MLNYLISSSIVTAVMIVLLLLLQPLINRKYSSSTLYFLWICVLLRLIIPLKITLPEITPRLDVNKIEHAFSPKTDSVSSTGSSAYTNIKPEVVNKPSANPADNNLPQQAVQVLQPSIQADVETDVGIRISPTLIFSVVWLSGLFLILCFHLIAYTLFSLKLKKGGFPVADKAIADVIAEVQEDMRIRKKVSVIIYDRISTPQLFGFFRPAILLPAAIEDEEMLWFVLRHELTHYKRWDLYIKLLSLIVNAVYWFNPFAYLMRRNLDIYCELSCDEAVLKNLNLLHRKKYGEAVLTVMKNSVRYTNNLSTCFYNNKKILKKRLLNMMNMNMRRKGIALTAAVILTMGILGGCVGSKATSVAAPGGKEGGGASTTEPAINTINAEVPAPAEEVKARILDTQKLSAVRKFPENAPQAVIMKKNELDLINLKNSASVKLDDGTGFMHPIISPHKAFIAYLKDYALYIVNGAGDKTELCDKVNFVSYSWINKTSLIFSPEGGGLYLYNVEKNETKVFLENEYIYQDITVGPDNTLYAEKISLSAQDSTKQKSDFGVVVIQPDTRQEQLIITLIPAVDSPTGWLPGMFPIIAGISKDLRYLYILEHPHSGSLATDGVIFASYDINGGKYLRYEDKNVFTLTYKDNIASSSGLRNSITIINGGGREMNRDKTLGLLELSSGAFEPIVPKGMATMTPFLSEDGKTILYAASPESSNPLEEIPEWMNKGNHFIYSVNSKTKKVTQLTKSPESYDFSPMYIDGTSIIFFRSNLKDNLSLYKLENGKEIKLTDDVHLTPVDYNPTQNTYGHFETYYYFDVR